MKFNTRVYMLYSFYGEFYPEKIHVFSTHAKKVQVNFFCNPFNCMSITLKLMMQVN